MRSVRLTGDPAARLLWLCCLLVVSLGIETGQASAADRVASVEGDLEQGPLLVGGQVAWRESLCFRNCAQYESDGYCDDSSLALAVRLSRKGRRTRTLASGRNDCSDAGPSSSASALSFDISRSHFALERSSTFGSEEAYGSASTLHAGPIGGPLKRLYRCGDEEVFSQFALDGQRLFYNPTPCAESPDSLVVLNLRSGKAMRVPVPAKVRIYFLQLAGRYAAFTVQSRVSPYASETVVYDLAARSEAYRTGTSGALSRDGKMVVLRSVRARKNDGKYCERRSLSWYSPAEPRPHRIPVSACNHPVLFAGQRIVYLAPGKPGRSVKIATLQGKTRTVLRFNYESAIYHLDADSHRLAFATPRCSGGSALYTTPLNAAPIVTGSPRCHRRTFIHHRR